MHPVPTERTTAAASVPVVCRTLTREYRVHAPSEAARAAIAFLAADPEIEGATLAPVDIEVTESGGFHAVRLPGGRLAEGTTGHIVGRLHSQFLADIVTDHPADAVIHGASALIGGKRFLIVGSKAAGKTTLSLHLLARGYLIEGDEHLMVNADGVIARPRTLRVRTTTFDLVRNLPPGVHDSPKFTVWDGTILHAVHPALAGVPWVIRQGRLDHIVFLEPNHGGRGVVAPIAPEEAVKRLMANAYFAGGAVALAAARLRQLGMSTPAHALRNGDLANAERHLVWLSRS